MMTKQIAKICEELGHKPTKVLISQQPDVEDDSIHFDDWHIQVGFGYAGAGIELPGDKFVFLETVDLHIGSSPTLKDAVKKILETVRKYKNQN